MRNVDLTNRIQYIMLEDNLTWEEIGDRAGENGAHLREELMDKLEVVSELLAVIGYRIEIVRNSDRIRQ